jgi:hypothetical protein
MALTGRRELSGEQLNWMKELLCATGARGALTSKGDRARRDFSKGKTTST